MKRLLPCVLAAILPMSFFPVRVNARAEEPRYAVAAQSDVWFYAAEDGESGLFLIPYTYYVRILREGTRYSAVQYLDDVAPYKSITGYCLTDSLTFVDFIPERPFLKRELKVSYQLEGESRMGSGAFDRVERTFVYYGTSYSGTARYYYVYADGIFDYIPAVQEVLFELNTDYLEASSGELPSEGPEEGSPAVSPVQIALICGIAVAAVGVAAFVLRGKKPSPALQEAEF